MKLRLAATLKVEALFSNLFEREFLTFDPRGIFREMHGGFARALNKRDQSLCEMSDLRKGDQVFNTRSWTATSLEDLQEIGAEVKVPVEPGDLSENITFSGMEDFSKIPPGSFIVFPRREVQLVLAVWAENTPCVSLAESFAKKHNSPELGRRLLSYSLHRRGVMGFVYSSGLVRVGDEAKLLVR